MENIIKYLKDNALVNALAYMAIRQLDDRPEQIEDVVLQVIKILYKQNEHLRDMIITHHQFCINPVIIFKPS